MNHPASNHQEQTRKALRSVEVEEWLNHCAPEGAYLQQAQPPRRTCAELGVCQNRKAPCAGCTSAQPIKPAKPAQPAPHTVWVFGKWDFAASIVIVAIAYFFAGYFG
jgi:hypothetical protein